MVTGKTSSHLEESGPSMETVGNSRADEANAGVKTSTIGRVIQRPSWMRDYECDNMAMFLVEDGEELIALFVAEEDPETFEEAMNHEKWKKAMETEIDSIEENCTWELVDLPEGVKPIGVKWVYKTKHNERGEVDKFKARLVAKCFS